ARGRREGRAPAIAFMSVYNHGLASPDRRKVAAAWHAARRRAHARPKARLFLPAGEFSYDDGADLGCLNPSRSPQHEANIKKAARLNGNFPPREPDLASHPARLGAAPPLLRSAARARWRRDTRALGLLIATAPIAAKYFQVGDEGAALLVPDAFASRMRRAAPSVLDRRRADAQLRAAAAYQRGARDAGANWGCGWRTRQMAQLCRPFHSAQILAGMLQSAHPATSAISSTTTLATARDG
ncbi:unnamed protein product, partial [Prorocentrum cordatum]